MPFRINRLLAEVQSGPQSADRSGLGGYAGRCGVRFIYLKSGCPSSFAADLRPRIRWAPEVIGILDNLGNGEKARQDLR
jgi:hypothetical protein